MQIRKSRNNFSLFVQIYVVITTLNRRSLCPLQSVHVNWRACKFKDVCRLKSNAYSHTNRFIHCICLRKFLSLDVIRCKRFMVYEIDKLIYQDCTNCFIQLILLQRQIAGFLLPFLVLVASKRWSRYMLIRTNEGSNINHTPLLCASFWDFRYLTVVSITYRWKLAITDCTQNLKNW